MSDSPTQPERPTLPSIQDLLPDGHFESQLQKNSPAPPEAAQWHPGSRSSPIHGGARREPMLGSPTRPLNTLNRSPEPSHRATARPAPYPNTHHHPSLSAGSVPASYPPRAGEQFSSHLPGRFNPMLLQANSPFSTNPGSARTSAHQTLTARDLPTYVLSPDECPPDDDRRHGCGICHRRFNRPSSLMIHMNSHTGEQPFACPFPGCTRRFSVNSNMRRHYRNHRENADPAAGPPPPFSSFYRAQEPSPQTFYRMERPPSASSHSSCTESDGHPSDEEHHHHISLGRARSRSDGYAQGSVNRAAQQRPRSCTVAGCNCNEPPTRALRLAFPQGSSVRFSP